MVEGEKRRDESGENRRRTDVADDRDALADFGAGEAAHREQRDRHQDVGRYRSGGGEAPDHPDQKHKYRQRNDADFVIDERPPPLGPPAFGRALRDLRYAADVLHLFRSPIPAISWPATLAQVIAARYRFMFLPTGQDMEISLVTKRSLLSPCPGPVQAGSPIMKNLSRRCPLQSGPLGHAKRSAATKPR